MGRIDCSTSHVKTKRPGLLLSISLLLDLPNWLRYPVNDGPMDFVGMDCMWIVGGCVDIDIACIDLTRHTMFLHGRGSE